MRIISGQLWSTPQNLLTLRLFSDQHLTPIIFGQLRELLCSHVIHNVISVWTCCFYTEIHEKVKNGVKPYFRPTLEESDCPCDELAVVIRRCWAEDPMERPDFQALKSIIRKLNKWVGHIEAFDVIYVSNESKIWLKYQWFFMFKIILVILIPDSNSWIDIVNSSDHFYFFLFFKRIPTLASDYPQMKPKRFKDYVRNGLICCWFMIAFKHFLR